MFYARKQKTREYRDFQDEVRDTVIYTEGDKFVWPFGTSEVSFDVTVGLSNKNADLDNCIKPLLDTYQGMYEDFNDKRVYAIELIRKDVPRGQEFLEVSIYNYKKED